jgi:hypothetical protein
MACLRSEKCASDWMKAYNDLMKRIYEKAGILQVSLFSIFCFHMEKKEKSLIYYLLI